MGESQVSIQSKSIVLVPIEKLNPKPNNRNKHSPEQIKELARHFKYQGFRNPIIVSNQSGQIVCGHGRFEAAKMAGLAELPVIYQDFNNPEMEYAFHVADNGLALWADLDLSGINSDLGDLGPDFDIDNLGIKDFELEPADKLAMCDEDEVPEQVEPKANLGDIYQLGDHRLMCGDSTNIQHVETLMNGQKADMVFTDPPYGISIVKTGTVGASARVGFVSPRKAPSQLGKAREYKAIEGDDEPFDPGIVLGLGIPTIVLWGANHYASRLPDKPQWLVWDKKLESGKLDHNNFSDVELAWTNKTALSAKIYRHIWAGMLREGDRKEELKDRVHPTQKPVGLCVEVIKDFSKESESILDIYGGSGSTLIACEKTNRKCFMMELDPHYCSVIVERWIKYTGKEAYRVETDGNKTAWSQISI